MKDRIVKPLKKENWEPNCLECWLPFKYRRKHSACIFCYLYHVGKEIAKILEEEERKHEG